MLSVYGGWSKDDFTYGNHILLLKEAADNFFLPNVNRLQAQLDRGKWADVADAERLAEAVTQMLAAINVSLEIFEFLQTGDLASANAICRERSVPLFKAIWASNSTLISAAERRFPRW